MEVRTRFAPSPTGYLHLGSVRTAIFNFLFARKNKGKFFLRIEDTDKERTKEEYKNDIIEGLIWLGLKWDGDVIVQSERLNIYYEIIEVLLEKRKAYRCFCTKEELESIRQEQILKGEPPRYPGICKNLTQEEINERLSKNLPYVIRLHVPYQKITFNDYLRGEISWDGALIGDFVIAKSENEPLFHLATPVDDHFFKISHVIRGAEHIPNTPKQILIFKAMNWPIPIFAHIPLILGEEGGKLSKRFGAKSIREYREEGYLPEAIINFLALLGWHPKTDQEVFSLDELIKEFELERVQKKSAAFNHNKLIWFNRLYLRKKPNDEILKFLLETGKGYDFFEKKNGEFKAKNGNIYDEEKILKIIELGKERANTMCDIFESVRFFFFDFDYEKELLIWRDYTFEEIKNSLKRVHDTLARLNEDDFKPERLKEVLDTLSMDKGLTYWPLRVALTGLPASPPPIEIASIFGKDRTLKLVKKALEKL